MLLDRFVFRSCPFDVFLFFFFFWDEWKIASLGNLALSGVPRAGEGRARAIARAETARTGRQSPFTIHSKLQRYLRKTPRDGLGSPQNDAQAPHKRTITATKACRKCGEAVGQTPGYRPAVGGTSPARTKWTWPKSTSLVCSEPAFVCSEPAFVCNEPVLLKSSLLQSFTFYGQQKATSLTPLYPLFGEYCQSKRKGFCFYANAWEQLGRQPPLVTGGRRGEAETRSCLVRKFNFPTPLTSMPAPPLVGRSHPIYFPDILDK